MLAAIELLNSLRSNTRKSARLHSLQYFSHLSNTFPFYLPKYYLYSLPTEKPNYWQPACQPCYQLSAHIQISWSFWSNTENIRLITVLVLLSTKLNAKQVYVNGYNCRIIEGCVKVEGIKLRCASLQKRLRAEPSRNFYLLKFHEPSRAETKIVTKLHEIIIILILMTKQARHFYMCFVVVS